LKHQTDAKAQVTTMVYDKLGRMTIRSEPDLTSKWFYDSYPTSAPEWDSSLLSGLSGNCSKGIGKLCYASASNNYRRLNTYETDRGRERELSVKIDTTDTPYTVSKTYDNYGRLDEITYPTGFKVRQFYTSRGYLLKVQRSDAGGSTVFWQATAMNAAGGVTAETLGNGITTTTRAYDTLMRLTNVSSVSGTTTIQNQSYSYDRVGNITQRVDAVKSITETLMYDNLNRLIDVSGPNLPGRTFDNDEIGNITYKTDVGAYTYPSSGSSSVRPHAVTSVAYSGTANSITANYGYDNNGNLYTASGTIYPASGSAASFSRTLTYLSFNLPSTVSETRAGATTTYEYKYNGEHERVKLVATRPTDTLTSIYLHPAAPHPAVIEAYYKDYVEEFPGILNAGWGFTVEAATQAIRLVLSRVFETYPKLRVILGHLGESLPFSLWRINHALSHGGERGVTFRDLFCEHFYITTSGNFSNPALLCSVMELGVDRILFSVDYPFENNLAGAKWMENVPLCAEDRDKILHGNAARLLKL